MPITVNSLSEKLNTNLDAILGNILDEERLNQICDAIATAIFDEITTNAEVEVIGVMPGSGTAQGTIS